MLRRKLELLRVVCLAAGLAACRGRTSAPDGSTSHGSDAGADGGVAALRILFIGNSYTYVNDLPGVLTGIAATAGSPPLITTDSVVEGGATLQTHWENGIAQQRIAQGGWTHVVLQDQSVEPTFGVANFEDYAQRFGGLIADGGARTTMFVTWARAAPDPMFADPSVYTPAEMQDRLTWAYADVARKMPGSLLACAGEAFRRAIHDHPEIALQQDDFSHPTVAGTYLAACTFYVALTGKSVPAQGTVPAGLSASHAALLRDIALVGSACADVRIHGNVRMSDVYGKHDTADGGPFDFGLAGSPVASVFFVENVGGSPSGLVPTPLASGFEWSTGHFPGGAGTFLHGGQTWPYCSGTLDPLGTCVVSVSYTGAADSAGRLTLAVSDAYQPTATRSLTGEATQRAALTVTQALGFTNCVDLTCPQLPACSPPECIPPGYVQAAAGTVQPFSLIVTNRGGQATIALGEGAPLGPPFYWGQSGTPGAFPGGTGSAVVGTELLDYCSGALAPGKRCLVTASFAPTASTMSWSAAIDVAYSDAQGALSPDAIRQVVGQAP